MAGRVIDIAGEPRSLSLYRGFMQVHEKDQLLGRLDLDGVLMVLISSKGANITTALMSECAERLIPVLICNQRYQPVSIAHPVNPHFDQNRRHEVQFSAKTGLKNKLWQRIIRAKINLQAELLSRLNASGTQRLKRLASEVRAGDPENLEAQAAQIYWPCLFGQTFRRGNEDEPINGMLNYGYAVIRGAMLKAVLATGLHPSCGVHHTNRNNPFCLVDDLIEPYRPLIDQIVLRLHEKGRAEVNPQVKTALASIVTADLTIAGQMSPLFQDMNRFARSVCECLDGASANIIGPKLISDLEVEAVASQC